MIQLYYILVYLNVVVLSGMSTLMGYLMPNPVYTYMLCIWFLSE